MLENDFHRRSVRLPNYDYSQFGWYFVTVCTQNRECLFGKIIEGRAVLNQIGLIARQCWLAIPKHFPNVKLDEFVVMPNHIHGIIIVNCRDTACRVPTTIEQFGKPTKNSPPTIICSFKSASTKYANECRRTSGISVWQRNYYEHNIRNEKSYLAVKKYIGDNPLRWAMDRNNPTNTRLPKTQI